MNEKNRTGGKQNEWKIHGKEARMSELVTHETGSVQSTSVFLLPDVSCVSMNERTQRT